MSLKQKLPKTLPVDEPHASLDVEQLEAEFRLFSKYLVGEVPSSDFFERYEKACKLRLLDCPPSLHLDRVLKSPWMLGPIDAALGVMESGDELRRKLLIATAILEASPEYTNHFLSSRQGVVGIFLVLAWTGVTSVAKFATGFVLINIIKKQTHMPPGDSS